MHTALLLWSDGDAPITREALERWMTPDARNERDESPIFPETFSECKQLGLLTETGEDGALAVHPAFDALSSGRKADMAGVNGLAAIADVVREHVRAYLGQRPAPDPNFCRLLAWMLMQNGADFPITTKSAEELASRQDPDRKAVGYNSVRYGAARFWIVFLGFGWQQSAGGAEALQPDPTAAFARWMRENPPSSALEPLSEFLRRIATAYPWVEDGEIAAKVRHDLADGPARPNGYVNDTTALALCRLERKGLLQFRRLSDAESVWTLGWGGPRSEVSHIEWKGQGNI